MSSNNSLHSISESDVTESLVLIEWKPMSNKPPEIAHKYYSYHVQYKRTLDSDWTTGRIVPYNPDDDPPQATIDGLSANTEYQVRVLVIRKLNKKTDLLDDPSSSNIRKFTTGAYSTG